MIIGVSGRQLGVYLKVQAAIRACLVYINNGYAIWFICKMQFIHPPITRAQYPLSLRGFLQNKRVISDIPLPQQGPYTARFIMVQWSGTKFARITVTRNNIVHIPFGQQRPVKWNCWVMDVIYRNPSFRCIRFMS